MFSQVNVEGKGIHAFTANFQPEKSLAPPQEPLAMKWTELFFLIKKNKEGSLLSEKFFWIFCYYVF